MKKIAILAIKSVYTKINPERKDNSFEVISVKRFLA